MEEGFVQSEAAELGEGRGGDAAEGGGEMGGGGRGEGFRHAHTGAGPEGIRNEWGVTKGGKITPGQ